MISLFNGKLIEVTQKWLDAPWNGRFRCYFCGHKFRLGEKFRGIFTNNIKSAGGNPLVCEKCNTDDEKLCREWVEMNLEWRKITTDKKWWWFMRRDRISR